MNTTKTKSWKWRSDNTAYLGSSSNPDALVFACLAAPRKGRFHWVTMVRGQALAVSVDPAAAQKLARGAGGGVQVNTTTKTEPSMILAHRETFDGVTVYLHADGSVSDRLNYFRGKLPAAVMWRAIDDIAIYTHAELPAYFWLVRSGKWEKDRATDRDRLARIASGQVDKQIEINSRDRLTAARARIENDRRVRRTCVS